MSVVNKVMDWFRVDSNDEEYDDVELNEADEVYDEDEDYNRSSFKPRNVDNIERDYLIIQVVSKTKYPSKVLSILKDKLLNLEIITSDIKRKKNSEIANLVLGYEDVESVNDYLSYTLSKFNKIWDNEKEIIENMTTEKIKEIISKVSFEEISTLIVEPKKTEDK